VRPTLVLLAGPNGAGKTTLYETRIAPSFAAPFINADNIQRSELKTTDMNAAYEAAKMASARRSACLQARQSFATETVFSHPSKLAFVSEAKALGYRIMLFHISVQRPKLSVARVQARVTEGGHPVPEAKIRARFDRNGPLIRQAALQAECAHIFDNSALNQPPERLITFTSGRVSFVKPVLPPWALDLYEGDL